MTGATLAEAYRALEQADPVLGRLVDTADRPDPFIFYDSYDGGRTGGDNFAAMVLHILGQQISTTVAFAIYDRLTASLGGKPTPHGVLAAGTEAIRQLGASRSKASYLADLAERVASGQLDIQHMDHLTDQQAVEALIAVKGVGQWTAEMFLLHQLHRADILPAGDLGIRNAVRRAWRLETVPSIEDVRARGQAWAPYRSYASALLWRSLALPS